MQIIWRRRVYYCLHVAAPLQLLARKPSGTSLQLGWVRFFTRHSAVRCGPNLDAGDGLLQGLSVHKKEAGKWQSFPSSSIHWSLPTFLDVLVHTDSPLYIYVIVEEEFFLVILDIMHHMFIMLLMFTTIILILHIMFIQIARSKSMLRKSLFL